MKKRGKFLSFALLVLLVAATAVAAIGCAGKTKPDPDPAADDYDVKYVSTMPSGTDDGVTIDGVLSESVYAGQKTFVNYLSEDYDRTAEHISMTTYVGEKGWYVAAEVTDSALVYNGLLAPARNSTIHLYYLLASENANESIREIYMDAGRVYGRTPCNIGLMEYGVKVNGELNGATTGMTTELFIPWRAMGLTEKPENTDLLMYPMYSIPKGGGDYRNLSPLPNLSYVANQFYLFGGDGYSDKDADGAILGDAKNGHVKAGVWTYTDVEKTVGEDGKVTLSGTAGVHAGSYAKTYVKDIVAENYVVEATVKVTGRDYGKRDGRAGLTVDVAGGKRKTFAAYISAEEGNAAGLNVVPLRSFYGDDYDGRNNRTTNLSPVTLAGGKTLSDGVKLTLIKSGANLYGLADGEIILAETDNAIRGKCGFNFTAANVNAEFTDISYAVYDGNDEGMAAAIAGYGIRRIKAETEGYGNVYLDKIAVKDGGEVTLTVECGEDNVVKEIKINGEAVTDFAEKAEIFGTTVRYRISNVTEDTDILVTFDEYAGVKVSGTISVVGESGLNMSDSVIYAFRADGSVIPFEGRVNEDGTYEISLPAGTYDKIRVEGAGHANDFDKIGGAAIVIGADPIENADFALETRIPTVVRHGEGNSVWTMTGDKEYTVSGMSHGNAWVEGNFGKAKNFAISTRVIAEKPAEVGVSLYGSYNGRNDFDVMIRVTAGGKMGISLYGWATGWASPNDETCKVGKTYDPNDFRLTVVRNGDTVSVFVNDVFWKSYTGKITSNLDFSTMGEMRVGLAVRGLTGAVFRDYTFTEDQSAIEAIVSRLANVATLDETDGSVVVEGITAGRANIGAEVKFSVTPASGKFIKVLADGKAIGGKVNADGSAVYTYRMGADDVNFTYDVKSAYAVSGTIPEDLAGATVSVISDGTETVYNNALYGTAYSIVLPSGTYNIKFVGKTAEGMISGVVVDGAAVEANLDKAYRKVTQQKHGGGAGAGKGEWTLTDNGVYSVSPLGDGDSYTLGVMGKAKNFVLSARIKGGSGKEVGVGLEYSGKNLMLIKVGSGTLVAFYTWQGGWSETRHPISWGSGNANDYTYTVIRKDNTMYALINGTLIGTFTGKINANHDLSAIGETEVGMLRRGNAAGEVTFSEYSFSTDSAKIDEYLYATVSLGSTWNDADGSLEIGGIENGKAKLGSDITFTVTPAAGKTVAILANGAAIPGTAGENGSTVYAHRVTGDVTFTYEIENIYAVSGSVPTSLDGASLKAVSATGRSFAFPAAVSGGEFSVTLPDGTYSLYVANDTHEGLIKSVIVDGAAVENVNLDKAYIKPLNTQAVHGGTAQAANELTNNGEYTIAAANNGNSTNGLLFGKAVAGDFILSAKISTPTDMRTEVGVQINSKATDILMFRFHTWNGGTSMYGWGSGMCGLDNEAGTGKTFDKTGFVYTLVRKDNAFYMIIDGTLWKTYSGSYTTTDAWGKGIDLASIGAVDVELAIRGTTTGNKFSDYSFSTSAADIDAAITAVVDTGVWNDTDGIRTVSGVTDGKAYLGDSVVITVTPQENKIIKVFANGTALSGAINGDSYVYTYKVNSTAKITFSYEVTNLYAVSGNVTSDLSGATIKVTDAATGSATEYKSAVGAGGDYSIALPDGTYSLYVANDTHEGLIKSVVVGGAAAEANLDKAYRKVTQQKYGGGSGAGKGEWTLTDNGVYSVSPLGDGGSYTLGRMGKAKNFVLSARIRGGAGKEVGIGLEYSGKNLMLIKTSNNNLVQFYTWQGEWLAASGINWGSGNADDFTYTVVRKDDRMYAFVNGTLAGNFVGKLNDNHDLSTMGETEVGMLRRGNAAGDVTFSDYSFSTSIADIDAAITAVVDTGVWNDTDGIRTVSGVTDGKAYLGDSVVITVTPQENKIIKVFANGTALSGAINGDSYVYTYKVNSTAKITFSYEVTNLYAVSGNVTSDLSGATIKVTDSATGSATEYKSVVGAGGDYSIALPDGSYSLYVANDTHEGLIKSVVVDGAAVEANLDKAHIKPLNTQAVHGGAAQAANALTNNGEYTIAAAYNGNSTNGLLFGKAVAGDFILSAKISTPTDMRTEVGVQINSKATDILMFRFHTWNGGTSMYGWGSGMCGLDNEAGTGKTFDKTGFVYTLVRKDNAFYMIIDGTLWKTYSGSYTTTDAWGKGIDLASIGAVDVELAIRGTTTGNKFSEYSFSTSAADIDAALGLVEVTGTVADSANGTVTATDTVGGATYSAVVANGAYTVAVGKNATYKLYFDCGDKEGLVSSVAVGETATVAANATLAQKVNWLVTGGRTVTMNGTGSYTVSDNEDGAYSFGLIGTAAGSDASDSDFMVSARIVNGKGRHVGIALRYGEPTTFLSFIKAGGNSNVCAYNLTAWESTAKPVNWETGNVDDYTYTVVKTGGEVKVYVDDKLIATYTSATVGEKTYNVSDLKAIDVQVGLTLCWTKNPVATAGTTSATFTDYSFSTDSAAINDYVTAHSA